MLGVWSRDEVTRVDNEGRWVFRPGAADGLEWRFPPQRLEVLCEVVCGYEGENVRLETFEARIVEDLDGRLFDRAVHSLGLSISPGVIRLRQLVLDAVLSAHTIEDVRAEVSSGGSIPVLWEIGEGHAVVSEHGVDFVGEDFNDVRQEGRAIHLAGVLVEFDIGELRDAVDRQEHVELAFGEPQLANIDVDVADRCVCEPSALGSLLPAFWQAGDAVPHQASVETGSCELRNAVLQAAEDIVERKQRPPPKFDDHRFLHGSEHRALGIARPHRRIRGRRPRPPFGNGRPAQAITAGEAAGRLFRRLELGSNSRRCPGAAVENVCHSASSDSTCQDSATTLRDQTPRSARMSRLLSSIHRVVPHLGKL